MEFPIYGKNWNSIKLQFILFSCVCYYYMIIIL